MTMFPRQRDAVNRTVSYLPRVRPTSLRRFTKLVAGSLFSQVSGIDRMSATSSEHEPFLTAIDQHPDQFEAYGVYSDWLSEQGDPRGEFMRLQWRLEDESFSGTERQAAKTREKELLELHGDTWLGDLAPELTGRKPVFSEQSPYRQDSEYQYRFARGFLDSVSVDYLLPSFAEKLRRSESNRFLRHLAIDYLPYGEQLVEDFDEYADQNWEWEDNPSLDALLGGQFPNLRSLDVGTGEEGGCSADNLHRLIDGTPRLEMLFVAVHGVNTEALFAKKMPSLKSLTVDHLTDYPFSVLADNPSLGHLQTISFTPHMVEPGDDPYIQVGDIRALCRSPYLGSLKHLVLQCSDFGDEGMGELISSGLFSRLESLRLPYGSTTDEGARMILAARWGNLRHLDLTGHYLSSDLCAALQELASNNVTVRTNDQHTGNPNSGSMEHLWYGDME